jgi:hypothetical protein
MSKNIIFYFYLFSTFFFINNLYVTDNSTENEKNSEILQQAYKDLLLIIYDSSDQAKSINSKLFTCGFPMFCMSLYFYFQEKVVHGNHPHNIHSIVTICGGLLLFSSLVGILKKETIIKNRVEYNILKYIKKNPYMYDSFSELHKNFDSIPKNKYGNDKLLGGHLISLRNALYKYKNETK